MFGAGVAERVGLFSALIRGSLRDAPRAILTPLVCIIGMMSHHASDAAYVVFIPLAALLYAAVGRHPLVGLAAAFAVAIAVLQTSSPALAIHEKGACNNSTLWGATNT